MMIKGKVLEQLYQRYIECGMEVTTDSRRVKAGSLFFALVGDKFDGNDYALAALEQGARYAVVDREGLAEADPRLIFVPDSLMALQQLARYHRDALSQLTVIGITGTNGKTTTKELMAAIFMASHVSTLYTEGNLNNHIGVPLTLLRLRPEHRVAVIEMGASHRGDIKELVEIVHPNMGVITNVGVAHLEGFGSKQAILLTKSELFDYLLAHHGTIILNADDQQLALRWQEQATISYSLHPQEKPGLMIGEALAAAPYLTMRCYEEGLESAAHLLSTQLVGLYNASNILAALATTRLYGIPLEKALPAITEYQPTNHRSQLVEGTKGRNIIIDAYNANPSSMMVALRNLDAIEAEHKVAILGAMLELGEASETEHHKVSTWCLQHSNIETLLCGTQFTSAEDSLLKHFTETSQVEAHLESLEPFPPHTTILLKGSHGMALERLLPTLLPLIQK